MSPLSIIAIFDSVAAGSAENSDGGGELGGGELGGGELGGGDEVGGESDGPPAPPHAEIITNTLAIEDAVHKPSESRIVVLLAACM
jgi:hypothetical protein